MRDFQKRTVLVTGASGGIGAEVVRLLTEENAHVVGAGREGIKLARLASETGCDVLEFDLTNEREIEDAIGGLALWGVVNSGGFGGEIATPMDTNISVFDKVMSVNARGTMLVTKYASRNMIAADNGGSIVNVSSQASLIALPNHVSYGASKAAVDSITRVSALELGKHNIRVNSVHPTVVMTEMSKFYWGRPEVGDPVLARMPLGRWATEKEVAGPIAFLLSDEASMITGAHLPIDGGYTCV